MLMRLRNPAPGRRISSKFGPRRDPISGKAKTHGGIDWAGQFDVLAAGDGVVVASEFDAGGLGYYVIIEHSPTLRTVYGHGATRSKFSVGDRISEGDVVFLSGSTGYSTGNHLHFEVRIRDRFHRWVRTDPLPFLNDEQPAEPLQLPEEEDTMLLLMINDGLGRYGAKGKNYWAVSGAGYWWVTDRQDVANPLSVRLGNAAAPNLTYEEWEAAKAASIGGGAASGDLAPVLAAIAQVPTAAENGRAARAESVK